MIGDESTAMPFECGPPIGLSNNMFSLLERPDSSSSRTNLWTDPAEKGTLQSDLGPPIRQFATEEVTEHEPAGSVKSTRSRNAESHYWCTVCEEPNSYKDSGSWKKHEKEHETVFVCGLEHTAGQSHASKVFTCKRRDIMVNHLNKSHGAIEAHRGRELAEEWRHTVKKQAWSCGFCITPFLTFQDRLKHVDIEHFRRHQSIHEWDLNKVILGLLQQPKMEKAWKTRAASLTPWVQPEGFAWDKAIAKDLRARLEVGPSDDQDANALADEAYSASKANEVSWTQSGTNHANLYPDATAQAGFLSSQRQYRTISTPMSDSGLYHRPSPAIRDSAAHLSSDSLLVGAPTSTLALNKMTQPAVPSFDDGDDDGLVGHNASLFSSSRTWTSTPETATFLSGHEQSNDYGGQGNLGGDWSTPNW